MTQQDRSRAIDAPRLRGPRGNTATAVSHVEAQTRQISSWPLRPSQAVRRKHRWSLANWQNLTLFFSFFFALFCFLPLLLHGGRKRRQHISLFWIHMLPSSHRAQGENMCVCEHVYVSVLVGCSEPWHPADGFIWHSYAIWRMFLLLSARWSAVIWAETEGELDVSFLYELPVRGLTLQICSGRKNLNAIYPMYTFTI